MAAEGPYCAVLIEGSPKAIATCYRKINTTNGQVKVVVAITQGPKNDGADDLFEEDSTRDYNGLFVKVFDCHDAAQAALLALAEPYFEAAERGGLVRVSTRDAFGAPLPFNVIRVQFGIHQRLNSFTLEKRLTYNNDTCQAICNRRIEQQMRKLESAKSFVLGPDRALVFKGNLCYAIDTNTKQTDPGYPITIESMWSGVFPGGIDNAFSSNGKIYLIKGTLCAQFEAATRIIEGVQSIDSVWPGIWTDGFDAVVAHGNQYIYFFKRGDYKRFNVALNQVDLTTTIKAGWGGLPDNIERAFTFKNGHWYFVKGSDYWRFQNNLNQPDANYPMKMSVKWPWVPKDFDAYLQL